MDEVPSEGPDDWFFDNRLQQWLRHSGKTRWRRVLAERTASRDPRARAEMLERLSIEPTRPDGYAALMRRPDIELSGEAAAFIERHPELAERLAGHADEHAPAADELRTGIRTRIREMRAAFDPQQAADGADTFRARYGL